jgi:3-oxoacyl-[acyl-carrier protein] reductase
MDVIGGNMKYTNVIYQEDCAMANKLNGKIALVTGASRGIGRAIAVALAHSGADVAVNYHSNESAALEVCAQIREMGQRSIPVQGDVAKNHDVARIVNVVRQELGPITILVNNSGIGMARTAENITEQDWDEMLAVNLKAPFLVTQTVIPDMRTARWGRIISLSSAAAQMGGVVGPIMQLRKEGS